MRNQKFLPAADPFPGVRDGQKFNQMEMETFTYKPSLVKIDRYTQFRIIVVTDP